MSRIGKKPVPIPSGVKLELAGREVRVSGPKGSLKFAVPHPIEVEVAGGQVNVRRPDDLAQNRALHGLVRALIQNMCVGASKGYEKRLEIYGTGYNAKLQGKQLLLNVGFMGRGVGRPAQFVVDIPDGVQVDVEVPAARGNNEPAKLAIRGADKQLVGQLAAEIRAIRKPEPYLGKGIRYANEQIRRKAGKVFAGGG